MRFDYYLCDHATRMFSKACEYGIRAMLYIARRSKEGTRVGIREISKAIDSPEPFMAKILQDLSRKGLVLSIKGPNGGFYMHLNHLQISLADIVSAIDGDQLFTGCGLGLKACNEKKPCPIHYQFKALREDLKKMLQATAVGEFTESLEKGMFHLRRA